MRIEHTIEIDAPADRVWALTLDVERWPDHTPTMERIERLDDGPLTIGSAARIKQPGQRAKIWTVTELVDGSTFAWGTRAFGMTMTGRHHITDRGSGSTQTLVVDIDGPLAPVLGRLLSRPILAAITAENEGFKAAAESI